MWDLEMAEAWVSIPDYMREQWQTSNSPILRELRELGIFNHEYVLGFDLCNLEPGHSVLRHIFASGDLRLMAPAGGMRVHCGEGVDHWLDLRRAVLMARVFRSKARLGHAVGFALHSWLRDEWRSKTVVKELEEELRCGLGLEVNLTSNRQLLGIPYQDHPLGTFIRLGWPVVLGTDDPSVWPESELRREFELAIEYGHVATVEDLFQLVRNSIKFSFLPADRKAALSLRIEAELAAAETQ
jgi:adenosine deaminase